MTRVMTQTDTTVTFSREDIVHELDRIARQALGLSAQEFVYAWREHRIIDRSTLVDAAFWLNLLRDDDPLFDRA